MKKQEIITIFTNIPKNINEENNITNTYPELNKFFEKGMYIENVVQNCLADGRCVITFVFRHYYSSPQKEE